MIILSKNVQIQDKKYSSFFFRKTKLQVYAIK